jgi:hypothetical protein
LTPGCCFGNSLAMLAPAPVNSSSIQSTANML